MTPSHKSILTLLLLACSLGGPGLARSAPPAAAKLHFKVDHGVQPTAFGQLHLYEEMWPTRREGPVYPKQEHLANITGTVTMDVLIAEDGTVTDVRVRKSSGNANLDAAALLVLHRWKYPALNPPERYVNIETWEFMIDG